jgi:hypothetical protein
MMKSNDESSEVCKINPASIILGINRGVIRIDKKEVLERKYPCIDEMTIIKLQEVINNKINV